MKNLFIHIFVELMQDFKKYSYSIGDYPVFNSSLIVESKKDKNDKFFIKIFCSTQLFQIFIQDYLSDDKETYFQLRLTDYLKKTEKDNIYLETFKNFENDYSSFFNIKKKYVIKSEFIKGFKEYGEKDFESKEKCMKLRDESNFLSKHIQERGIFDTNLHGVFIEKKRIIDKFIELSNNNDPKNIDFYIIPDQDNINTSSLTKKKKPVKSILSNISNNQLTENEKDEIRENIREILATIFRSDYTKIEADKKKFLNLMNKQYAREHLIMDIFPKNKGIKYLSEESYNFLSEIFFNLLSIIIKEKKIGKILTAINAIKNCLYIKITKGKEENELSDDLFQRLEESFSLSKANFWEELVIEEITESDKDILRLIKEKKDDFDYKDDANKKKLDLYKELSYDILEKLTSLMKTMKIQKDSKIEIFDALTKIYIIDKDQSKSLMNKIKEENN